jgi:hypothetical protein
MGHGAWALGMGHGAINPQSKILASKIPNVQRPIIAGLSLMNHAPETRFLKETGFLSTSQRMRNAIFYSNPASS